MKNKLYIFCKGLVFIIYKQFSKFINKKTKNAQIFEQSLYQRRYMSNKKASEKLLNVISPYGNVN